jgi:hypothetical protein
MAVMTPKCDYAVLNSQRSREGTKLSHVLDIESQDVVITYYFNRVYSSRLVPKCNKNIIVVVAKESTSL